MRLLAAREHSRLELDRKLSRRGFAPDAIAGLLDELIREGALCESRLAESYVTERLSKGFGPLRIREELRRKGLAEDLIDPHLRLNDDEWLERIGAVYDRRYGLDGPADSKEKARRARFLEGRGFPASLIGRFLARAR